MSTGIPADRLRKRVALRSAAGVSYVVEMLPLITAKGCGNERRFM